MAREHSHKMHLLMSGGILLFGFVLLIFLFTQGPDTKIGAMFAVEDPYCDDGTKLKDCSENQVGNMCVMSKYGPRLEYSDSCY